MSKGKLPALNQRSSTIGIIEDPGIQVNAQELIGSNNQNQKDNTQKNFRRNKSLGPSYYEKNLCNLSNSPIKFDINNKNMQNNFVINKNNQKNKVINNLISNIDNDQNNGLNLKKTGYIDSSHVFFSGI